MKSFFPLSSDWKYNNKVTSQLNYLNTIESTVNKNDKNKI